MKLVAGLAALLLATPLAAQERRQAPGGSAAAPPAPLVLPDIAPDPSRPFVGVWQGDFHGPFGGAPEPMTVAIEFANGGYAGYSAMGPMVRFFAHATDSVIGDTLQWTQPNNGGGTLVYRARRTAPDVLSGTMTLVNGPADLMPYHPTFVLRRRGPGNAR